MQNKVKHEISKITSSKIIFCFLSILLILLPFNALINTFFVYELNIGVLKFWKEILFGLIGVFTAWNWRKLISPKSYNKIEKSMILSGLAYITLILIHLLIEGISFGSVMGLRLDGLIVITMITGICLNKILNQGDVFKLGKYLIGSTFVSLVLALIVYFLAGNDWLVNFGFRNDWSTYYVNQGLAFCQKIEASEVCRFQGFLSGPNQMGAFLILYFGLIAYSKPSRKIAMMLVSVGLIGLFLTFSRSAWLGSLLGAISYVLVWKISWVKENWLKLLGGLVIFSVLAEILFGDFFRMVIVKAESSSLHVTLWMDGFRYWLDNFWLGGGIGSIGPSGRYIGNEVLIPESWFLQVAGQYGIVGLGLFVGWYGLVLQNLKEKPKVFLGLVWFGLLIPLNLLHSFESASLVYALGLLSGMVNQNESKTK